MFGKMIHLSEFQGSGIRCEEQNRRTRKRYEICLKLTRKVPDVIDVVLVSLLLTLNIFQTFFQCFYY